MPDPGKTYKVGNEVYDIPDSESQAFLKDNPGAIEVRSFRKGTDTFDIPLPEVDSFLKEVPDALPINGEKKNPVGNDGSAGFKGKTLADFGIKPPPVPSYGKTDNVATGQMQQQQVAKQVEAVKNIAHVAKAPERLEKYKATEKAKPEPVSTEPPLAHPIDVLAADINNTDGQQAAVATLSNHRLNEAVRKGLDVTNPEQMDKFKILDAQIQQNTPQDLMGAIRDDGTGQVAKTYFANRDKQIEDKLAALHNSASTPFFAEQTKKIQKEQAELDRAKSYVARKFAVKNNPDNDPYKLGLYFGDISGDQSAQKQINDNSKNIPVHPEQKFNTTLNGLYIQKAELEDQYALKEKDDVYYHAAKAYDDGIKNLINQPEFKEYKHKQLGNLVVQEVGKYSKPILQAALAGDKVAMKELQKKTGLTEEQIKFIRTDDLPSTNAAKSFMNQIYKAGSSLAAGGVRIMGSQYGIDKDILTHANETINESGDKIFGNNPYEQLQHPATIVDKETLTDIANPKAGKTNYTSASIANATGSAIGGLVGFVAATKGLGAVMGGTAKAERAGMYANIIGSEYEPNFQNFERVIPGAPEWQKHLYAVGIGAIHTVAFEFLPKDKLGLLPKIDEAAAKEFKRALGTGTIEQVNKEALKSWGAKVMEGIVKSSGESLKINAAQLGGSTVEHLINGMVGKDDGSLEEHFKPHALGEAFLSMAVPLSLAHIPHAQKVSSIYKESLYDAGLHPMVYKANIGQAVERGFLTGDQGNAKAATVDAMANIVASMPETHPTTGKPLTHNQRVEYANNRAKEIAIKAKAEGVEDKAMADFYKTEADKLVQERVDIINGAHEDNADVVGEHAPTGDSDFSVADQATAEKLINEISKPEAVALKKVFPEPNDLLQNIAQQSLGIQQDGSISEIGNTKAKNLEDFGAELVELAIKKFPPTIDQAAAIEWRDKSIDIQKKREEELAKIEDQDFGGENATAAEKAKLIKAKIKEVEKKYDDKLEELGPKPSIPEAEKVEITPEITPEVKVEEVKKVEVSPKKEEPKQQTRQDQLNDIIDDVARYNDPSKTKKGSPEGKAMAKDIQARAKALGLKYKMTGTRTIHVDSAKGKKLMKVNKTKNSTLAEDFDPKDYSTDTHDFIDNILTVENAGTLPRIKGVDGKFMTEAQVEAAVIELKAGKVTNGGKAVYDAIEKIVKDNDADYSESRVGYGQQEQVTFEKFKELFKEPTKEIKTAEEIDFIEGMGTEAFEKYLNELIEHETDYYKHTEKGAQPDSKATPGQPAPDKAGTKEGVQPVDEGGKGKGDAGAAKQGSSDTDLSSATKRVDDAQKAYDKAQRELAKVEKQFEDKQAKQQNLIIDENDAENNIHQKDMFANDADLIKQTTDPLKAKVKEAKAELAKATEELEKLQPAEPDNQPKLFDDKVDAFADKMIDFLTPKSMKGKDIKKSGIGVEELVRGAAEIIKKAYKLGHDLNKAIDDAIDYIKAGWAKHGLDKKVGPFDEAATRQAFRDAANKIFAESLKFPQTGEALNISRQKFKRAVTKAEAQSKPNIFSRAWQSFKNLSFYIDNPYRHLTKMQHDIENYYNKHAKHQIPLGRLFEQNAIGEGFVKVGEFVDTVLKGLKKKDLDNFHEYIFARRVKDRYEQQIKNKAFDAKAGSRETGNITLQDAVNVLAEMETRLGPEKMADFKRRAEDMQAIMDKSLQRLVESGMLSEKAYEDIKSQNDFYAPFAVVQELSRYAEGKETATVPASTVKRIKGIEYKDGKFETDDLQKAQEAFKEGTINKEEFYQVAQAILEQGYKDGSISEEQYFRELNELSDAGFTISNIFDKAATLIFDSYRLAHKNELLTRVGDLAKMDKENMFTMPVEGHEVRYDKEGEAKMIPKKLTDIKVPEGFGVVGYKENGKQKFIAIDREAANTINGLDKTELAAWMKGMNAINTVFRTAIITLSPAFQFANMVIDTVRSASMSRYGLITGKTIGDGIANAALWVPQYVEGILTAGAANLFGKQTNLYKEFMKSKGYSSGMYDDPFQNKGTREIKTTPKSFVDHIKYGGVDKLFNIVEGIGKTFEQAHKIVSVERGMDVEAGIRMGISRWKNLLYEAKTPIDMANALDKVAYETQNFAGSPNFPATHSMMKTMSVVFQFLSARVKGEMTDYRRIATMFGANAEGIKMTKGERLHALAQFAAVITPIVLMAMHNNKDEESTEELMSTNPWSRDNSLMIPAGKFEAKDKNGHSSEHTDYVMIPLRGVTSTVNVMANSFLQFAQKEEPEVLKQAIIKTLGNASPLNLQGDDAQQVLESTASNLTPLLKFSVEFGTNRNTFKHKDLIDDTYGYNSMLQKYKRGEIKPYEVVEKNNKTPEWAIETSKYLFDEAGISITPITLDYMENTFLGNASSLAKKNVVSKRVLRSSQDSPVYENHDKKK